MHNLDILLELEPVNDFEDMLFRTKSGCNIEIFPTQILSWADFTVKTTYPNGHSTQRPYTTETLVTHIESLQVI